MITRKKTRKSTKTRPDDRWELADEIDGISTGGNAFFVGCTCPESASHTSRRMTCHRIMKKRKWSIGSAN